MTPPDWPTGLPLNFGGLDEEFAALDRARVAILPAPYDFSTTYQGGTRWGPRAILDASRNMELWDDERGATYRHGIHTLDELEPTALGPEAMSKRVESAVAWILTQGKLPVMLGGEHSLTAGAVRAVHARYPGLSVLQLDAHADMRDVYLDSPFSHACVMRRVREKVPAASVGIRSLSEAERTYLDAHPAPIWSTRQFRALHGDWKPILDSLTSEVYVTFDLDALDPSLLPGTGTPEPGGLDWYEAVDLLAAVASQSRIVGFDVVELAPLAGHVASDFLAARLTYRMIGLALGAPPSTGWAAVSRTSEPAARLLLKRNQDRRLRGGHPWVFSNEVESVEGEPADGSLVDIHDSRGAFLGRGYWNKRSLIAARVLTRGRDPIDVDFFVKRFERAKRFRERVLPGATALRLVSSEADQVPGLVVDRYGDILAVQILTLGIEVRADEVREALERVFAPRGAWRMADGPLRSLEGLPLERAPWWGDAPEKAEVDVEGFTVEVDFAGGQKTGLFLDQRLNRRRAESRASGRKVLDLFCYQGEWVLHALRGGATKVLAIDRSQGALEIAKRNLARNAPGSPVTWRRGEVIEVLREVERSGERFGMVIVDPPALIKSGKHMAAGARAYREINRAAMSLLDEEGVLISCSCSHHLDDALFRQVLLEAARGARRPFRVLEWEGESPDHPQLLAVPETHYLKCAVLQAL